MKKKILRYLKHIIGTILSLIIIGIIVIVAMNGTFDYNHNDNGLNLDKEGPYVFFKSDSIYTVDYIRGNKEAGFYLESNNYQINEPANINCYFPLDHTNFDINFNSNIEIPKSTYNDGEAILAISDIESGYKTFRDYLINNKVINENLKWTFGKGHLVLVGDFVDRGMSTTQVIWFIYKLEQEASEQGGHVHFIIGNHELYNLQGKYKSASYKYSGVASILGKQQHNLYDNNSFIGKWLVSKNTIEIINGNLFTHGGIHPNIVDYDITLDDINRISRENYRKPWFPKPEDSAEQLILSSKIGLSWYRGYFDDELTQEEIDRTLKKFNAKAVIVGHTPQWTVKSLYNNKVFAIDVKHPKDYRDNWPSKKSEGLLIMDDNYIRLLNNQKTFELKTK
ncbi:metallophosphoesterase [Aurantibacter sp.]|uniref:metallophosphoesterase n=1 Tax=Aurantibacter sp. TaxID=2807103 RepID=UPI0032659EAB